MDFSAQRSTRKNSGFTLLELMIVVAIVAAVTGFTVPNFSNYVEQQNLRQSQDQIKSDLMTTQLQALNSVKESVADPTYWGVFFEAGETKYAYLVTNVAAGELANLCSTTLGSAAWTNADKSESLPADIEIKNDVCVFYSFENGNATTVLGTSVVFGYPSETTCFSVSVNEAGAITESTGVSCT